MVSAAFLGPSQVCQYMGSAVLLGPSPVCQYMIDLIKGSSSVLGKWRSQRRFSSNSTLVKRYVCAQSTLRVPDSSDKRV